MAGAEPRSPVLLSRLRVASGAAGRRARVAGVAWSVLVVVLGVPALGCAGGETEPRNVSLAELVAEHEAHDGSLVTVEGTVQTYDQPRHYWIEDADQHRVELFPPELVEDRIGHRIRVTGRFTFIDDRGRGIEIDDLDVLSEPPVALASPIHGDSGSPGLITVAATR